MSASEGDGDEVSTGISLLASVDEQSLRSARADIEDALADPISVDVSVDAPDVGGSGGVATQPLPDGGLSGVAGESQDEGLSPNRERRFARREHRWARQRTEDQEDLLTAVRDIEDSLDENFTDGGGLFGGLFGGIGDILGDFGGAAALTGAAAALTGAAKALVGAAVALGGGAVLDTVTDTLFGGGGDDSESVKLDEDELQSLSQIEGVDSTLTDLVQLQQQTIDAINNIDSGGGGDDGPFGFNPPDFEFPSPPDFLTNPPTFPDPPKWLTNPPEFPDLPDFLGGGNGGGQDVTVTVAPNPLPVAPDPLPVEDTTLPVEGGPVELTPVPVPLGLPGNDGSNGSSGDSSRRGLPEPGDEIPEGGLPSEPDAKLVYQTTFSADNDNGGLAGPGLGDLLTGPFDVGSEIISDVSDGSAFLGGLLGDNNASTSGQSAATGSLSIDFSPETTVNLGDITAEVTANFDRLKQDLLTEVTSALDQQEREFEQEIDRIERELENETRDIRREIDRGLRD
jgi:hypothetical protein